MARLFLLLALPSLMPSFKKFHTSPHAPIIAAVCVRRVICSALA